MLYTESINKDPDPKWWLRSVPEVNTWSDINILRFLKYYQNHPVLWNIHDPRYKNVCARQKAYRHIVQLLNLWNVNIDECKKLVERLKKRYVEEKEVKRSKCEKRPAWFEIIRGIVTRILNPNDTISNFDSCQQCNACGKTPSESTVSTDYQACKDCCADQNLHPPCEYYCGKDETSEEEKESNPCNFQNVECYTICDDEVKVVLLNLGGPKVKQFNSDCDCKTDESNGKNSDCDCETESSKKSEKDCDCCKCNESLPSMPKSCSSSEDKSNSDCSCSGTGSGDCSTIPSVSTVAKFCIKPMPERKSSTSSNETSSSSKNSTIDDENAKTSGIFMDSRRRFSGKRISLVDEYNGDRGIIAPRLHRARCCCGSNFYPLQIEL